MLLQGKKVLIVGVLDRKSIAYAIAEQAQQAGAEILLTSFGRVMSITQMTAKRLDPVPDILELDATKPEQVEAVCKEVEKRWGRLDGLVHSIAGAPNDALGGNFLHTPFESAAVAFHIGAFSLKTLAVGMLPVMREYGGSIITLDFDNSTQAWPKYDWMGVSKSALESIVRYPARDLGRYGGRDTASARGGDSLAGPTSPDLGVHAWQHPNMLLSSRANPSGGELLARVPRDLRRCRTRQKWPGRMWPGRFRSWPHPVHRI